MPTSRIGRPWPLLTGERGHYELLAGRDPLPYLHAMMAMASRGGMLPEQVWDAAAIPSRRLFPGHPSGSAMPLAWAHAEFVKLALSVHGSKPWDCPATVWERYRVQRSAPRRSVWLEQAPTARISTGSDALLCLHEASLVHWGVEGWRDAADIRTHPVPELGVHVALLPSARLRTGQHIDFTWRRQESGEWIGVDHRLELVDDEHDARGTSP